MLGLYGGGFDPVHRGHLGVAAAAFAVLPRGSRVVFIPTGAPPHRPAAVATAAQRLRMLRAALAGRAGYALSEYEIAAANAGAVSWSARTVRHFRRQHPDQALCLIMGSDAFKRLDSWRSWRALARDAGILVVGRGGDNAPLNATLRRHYLRHKVDAAAALAPAPPAAGGILWINAAIPAVSSTEVRAAAAAGRDLRPLVPRPVADIIRDERLYR